MDIPNDTHAFEQEWTKLAEEICERIYKQPEVQAMKQDVSAGKHLTEDQRSEFISTANKVKYEIIHERYGENGSDQFEEFRKAWRHWFDNKEGTSEQLFGRRLTNAEHVVYSSTPDPEEFLQNFE